MLKYSMQLAWSDEDEGYVATIAEFPGLSAFGETLTDAAHEAEIAVKGFIEVMREDGCPLPEPETVHHYSGQLRIRIPKSLHSSLSVSAKREGISLNAYIISLLSERNAFNMVRKEIESVKSVVITTSNEATKAFSQANLIYGLSNLWKPTDRRQLSASIIHPKSTVYGAVQ